jgi:DNA modification methylase
MGSGTTLVACELINRGMWDEFKLNVNETAKGVRWNIKSIGIEIVPEFVEIARKRLSVFGELLDVFFNDEHTIKTKEDENWKTIFLNKN